MMSGLQTEWQTVPDVVCGGLYCHGVEVEDRRGNQQLEEEHEDVRNLRERVKRC